MCARGRKCSGKKCINYMPTKRRKCPKRVRLPPLFKKRYDGNVFFVAEGAGDIVALSGLEVASGSTLSEEPADVTLLDMHVPAPVISVSAKVKMLQTILYVRKTV